MTDGPPTAAELDAALGDQDVTQLRVITLALMGGVVAFTVLAVVFAAGQDAVDPGLRAESPLLPILSIVHAGLFVGCLAARRFVGPAILRGRLPTRPPARIHGQGRAPADADAAGRAVQRLKGAHLTGLALLEGPALFGLTILVVAASQNALAAQPLYALNVFSTVVFLVLATLHFPSRERLLDQLVAATR